MHLLKFEFHFEEAKYIGRDTETPSITSDSKLTVSRVFLLKKKT